LEKDPARRFSSVREMAAQLPHPATSDPVVAAASAAGAKTYLASVVEPARSGKTAGEEPVARVLHSGCRRLYNAWNSPHLNTPARVVLIVVGIFLLASSVGVWFPLVVPLLILYCAYLLVRAIVLVGRAPARPAPVRVANPALQETVLLPAVPITPPALQPVPARLTPTQRRAAAARWREDAATRLSARPPRERMAELLGSMLVAALVALLVCVIMVVVTSLKGKMLTPEQAGWLGLVGIVGAWTILIPAKLWEGAAGESLPRRLVLMVLGLGVGVFAWALAGYLNVRLPPEADIAHRFDFGHSLPDGFFAPDGTPLLMAYLAAFGTLFLGLRWWRQADPLRASRLSLWSLLATVIVAAIVAALWQFQQPWLLMAAAVMSVAVQLGSPWVQPPSVQRR
jgi:DNA-directed RNA polymerase subunit H (RpoH/RPB5)